MVVLSDDKLEGIARNQVYRRAICKMGGQRTCCLPNGEFNLTSKNVNFAMMDIDMEVAALWKKI